MANGIEQLIIKGRITATSNRQNENFKSDPRKTAYITVSSDNDRKKLTEFGLTEYTSREDNTTFFIIKMSEIVRIYDRKGVQLESLDTNSQSDNFSTSKEIGIAILRGKSNVTKNTYNRIFALQVDTVDDIETVAPKNPFGGDDFDAPVLDFNPDKPAVKNTRKK